ncbi:MAG: ubiquinol-cytochrome c reductase iron-sulfur subunit [Gammaproteobacteria bacterium]|nr:ubiquinol-cytochrome c reductase iron-sulfur subunit [Thiotrichales bacterium]OUX50317.1 MAG: ubiquinol-cytochrome c reductase iron-sulfur subunit [Methylococcaceae bacterium TMED282]
MTVDSTDIERRQFLTGTAAVLGGLGAGVAAIPFVSTFQPSERAKAIGAPVEANIDQIEPGQRVTYKWRGKPVWIIRRTEEQLAALEQMRDILADPDSTSSVQPEFAENSWRSLNQEYLVLVGICTHLGCSPSFRPLAGDVVMGADSVGGFYCPCHGSKFDLSGRVYAGVPAPTNMDVPPYKFLNESRILIGELAEGEGA